MKITWIVSACLLTALPAMAQTETSLRPNLVALAQGNGVVNRSASPLTEGTRNALRLDARPGDGVAWVPNASFTKGTIEFDVRGKDLLQQSFVDIAFHGKDDKTYEAVYFRPFNFRSDDSVRRIHAVQYVAHPTYPWQKLRAESPGQYEAALRPAPDPNDWFHVRVEVAAPTVRVFVNNQASPALTVQSIGQPAGSRIGLWVGNNSGGDFANLTVTPAP